MDFGIPELTNKYLTSLQDAWNEFDKARYQHFQDNGSTTFRDECSNATWITGMKSIVGH